jgi:hypothetical protein
VAAAFSPHTVAVAANGAAADGDPVHPATGDADADEAARHRVPALKHDAGEVDPRPRRGNDDHPSVSLVWNPVTTGTDLHLALNLGAGPGWSDAWCDAIERPREREGGEESERGENHGRTGYPRSRRYARARGSEESLKWKMVAASTP